MRVVLFFLAVLFFSPAYAQDDFLYKDEPIDPVCLQQFVGMGDTEDHVSLAACTGTAKDTENGLEKPEDGSLGYVFKCEDGCMRPPFIFYKYLGFADGAHVVEINESGGGTGVFSSILKLHLQDGLLSIAGSLGGGDRCNGGIVEASVVDGAIYTGRNLTPFDLVDITQGNRAGFKAYDDIEACAACCVGVARYKGDELIAINLAKDAVDHASAATAVDGCFFDVINAYVRDKRLTLEGKDIQAFGQSFDRQCGGLKK